MEHRIVHDLPLDLARRAARRALDSYKERFTRYDPTLRWLDDDRAVLGFAIKGIVLSGTFTVMPSAFGLTLDVPFLLRPFKGKAIEVIEREVRLWVGRAKAG